jgi:hypothetical protein
VTCFKALSRHWLEAKCKGKVITVLNYAPRHEDLSGSGGIAPRILNLGTRWRRVVSFTLRPIYPQGRSSRYPLDRRLGDRKTAKYLSRLPGRDLKPRSRNATHYIMMVWYGAQNTTSHTLTKFPKYQKHPYETRNLPFLNNTLTKVGKANRSFIVECWQYSWTNMPQNIICLTTFRVGKSVTITIQKQGPTVILMRNRWYHAKK